MNRSRLRRVLCRDAVEWEGLQVDVSHRRILAPESC